MYRVRAAGSLALLLASGFGAAWGQAPEHTDHAPRGVDFPISCSEPAQAEFNRAVALLHHMTYPRARDSFEGVARLDPTCAMAHWGIAMTLFQPLWPTRPGPVELRRGWDAIQKARALGPITARERLLLDAAAAFFRDPARAEYWERIRRWEEAMRQAHAAFPGDSEVTAFYALAHLAVAPSDSISAAHSERAATLLLAIHEENPGHPGAMHYLVHANDAPGREGRSLDVVREYQKSAPRNPHALHMPTHIYTRLGDWDAVIRGNLAAAEAALEQPAGERGEFVWDEFPHALEYLIYAHLQKGADRDAAAQLERLYGTSRLQPSFKTAFHLASTRARFALERGAWGEAMSLPPREHPDLDWDLYTWPEAVTWFARGLAAAREGRSDQAASAARRLGELEATAREAGEALFARNIQILGLQVEAWLAQSEGDPDLATARMREAVELEVSTPKHAVTPAPTLPAHELLGDLLLAQGSPAQALAAYRRSLELYPRRFRGLVGAARAARAADEDAAARAYYEQLLQVGGTSSRAAVAEARAFVSGDGEGSGGEVALLELADSVFAAARARDADRFASHFSARPDFVYLINGRRLSSRAELRDTFASMLGRQSAFDPRWGARTVQMLTDAIGILTGDFVTRAREAEGGEEWQARGVVTFVAVNEGDAWRVVHWHTTE